MALPTNAKKRTGFWWKVLLGALLLGLLWRVRGTNGWGSSWGLLNAGFVFYLYLNFALDRRSYVGLPLMSLSALAFMLTCPAWGTYLNQITGILSVASPAGETLDYEISPLSGVAMMMLLGFGLASVYGVLLGRGFGKTAWRFRDYAAVLLVFVAADLAAKASLSHGILRLVEPQAVTAFTDALKNAGETGNAYGAYMAHFSAVSWAKKIAGTAGRNYFSSVGTISLVVAAVAVLPTVRFFVKDRYAAKTGALVCGAFAFGITVSDLFFFFANGGYHGEQGFSLPEGFAAWSLWEYFTGFIAGGIITAFLLKTAGREENTETLLSRVPQKPARIFSFALAVVGGIGLSLVRPVLERTKMSVPGIAAAAALAVLIFVVSFAYYKKRGYRLETADLRLLSPALCLVFTVYMFIVYFFVGKEPNYTGIGQAHNILVTGSAAAVAAGCIARLVSIKRKGNLE